MSRATGAAQTARYLRAKPRTRAAFTRWCLTPPDGPAPIDTREHVAEYTQQWLEYVAIDMYKFDYAEPEEREYLREHNEYPYPD